MMNKSDVVRKGWMLQLSVMGVVTDIFLRMIFPDEISSEAMRGSSTISQATIQFRNHGCSMIKKVCPNIAEFFNRDSFCCLFCPGYQNGKDNAKALKFFDKTLNVALKDDSLQKSVTSITDYKFKERQFNGNPPFITVSNLIRSGVKPLQYETYYLINGGKKCPPSENIYTYRKTSNLVFSRILAEKKPEDDLLLLRKVSDGKLQPVDYRTGKLMAGNGHCHMIFTEAVKRIISPSGEVACNEDEVLCKGVDIGGIILPIKMSAGQWHRLLEVLEKKFNNVPIAMVGLDDQLPVSEKSPAPVDVPIGKEDQPSDDIRILLAGYIKDAYDLIMKDEPPITDGSGQDFRFHFEAEGKKILVANIYLGGAMLIAEQVYRQSGSRPEVFLIGEDGTDGPVPEEPEDLIISSSGLSETDLKPSPADETENKDQQPLPEDGGTVGEVQVPEDGKDDVPPTKGSDDDLRLEPGSTEGVFNYQIICQNVNETFWQSGISDENLSNIIHKNIMPLAVQRQRDTAKRLKAEHEERGRRGRLRQPSDFKISKDHRALLRLTGVYLEAAQLFTSELSKELKRSDLDLLRMFRSTSVLVEYERFGSTLMSKPPDRPDKKLKPPVSKRSDHYLERRNKEVVRDVVGGISHFICNETLLTSIPQKAFLATWKKLLTNARLFEDDYVKNNPALKAQKSLFFLKLDGSDWLEFYDVYEATAKFITQFLSLRLKLNVRLFRPFSSIDMPIKIPEKVLSLPEPPPDKNSPPVPDNPKGPKQNGDWDDQIMTAIGAAILSDTVAFGTGLIIERDGRKSVRLGLTPEAIISLLKEAREKGEVVYFVTFNTVCLSLK